MSNMAKTEQFIQKAKLIHGDRYDYSLVNYTRADTKLIIVCREHGQFQQTPSNHIHKQCGCPVCSGDRKHTKEQFIQKAQLVHGDRYDYSQTIYKHSHTKISILCMQHGQFEQTPNSHLKGQGCAKCALSEKGWTRNSFKAKCTKNNNGLGILYVLDCFNDNERFFKIGITSLSVKERYNTKTKMPYAYSVVKEIVGDPEFIYDLEIKMHQQHKDFKYIPLIPFDGYSTECFNTYIHGS